MFYDIKFLIIKMTHIGKVLMHDDKPKIYLFKLFYFLIFRLIRLDWLAKFENYS